MKTFDLIILGGGAAGFGAAMKAADLKARTLMINDSAVGIGGTCVNVGCLPTKHLLHVAEAIHTGKSNPIKGLKTCVSFDFTAIMQEKDRLIGRLRDEKYQKVLEGLSGVEFIEGRARFLSPSEVQVNHKKYSAPKFIIATGSSTFIPLVEGIKDVDHLTNIEALRLKERPESMIILGGGPLGVEFAQMFLRFGSRISLLQSRERIVPREEPELSDLLHRYLQEEGIEICTEVDARSVRQEGGEKVVTALADGKEKKFKGEKLLIATGRLPNTAGLGLERLGIKPGEKGEVIVNETMEAGENVWAAGDVTGEPMLETAAAREGMIAANNALSRKKMTMDYRVIPHAVFTDPQLAGVGLTDEQASETGMNCRCHTVPMEMVPKAQAIGDTRGAVKVVIDNQTQVIVGVHILAPQAADLIHEAVMIVKNRMRVDDVIGTLHIFPTLSEAVKLSAQSFRRDIAKMSCCAE